MQEAIFLPVSSHLSECGLRTAGPEALKKGTGMVVHAHNPSTRKVETGRLP